LNNRLRHIRGNWHRLIPSRFPPVDVYERLGGPELRAVAKALEDKTNPRLRAKARLLGQTPQLQETSPTLQNWNHAPFSYRDPEGSTFLPPAYGVLEMVRGEREALGWALLRRERFLDRTREPAMGLDMRLLVTPVSGEFVDLTESPLVEDQDQRWKEGVKFYEAGAKGVLFRRPELPQALTLAVFDNSVLGRAVQSAHYRFVWDGKVITRIYDFSDGEEYLREALLSDVAGKAAA
jgi:hypothetical protein